MWKICFWQIENFPFESPKATSYIQHSFHCPAALYDICRKISLCLRLFSNCYLMACCMRSLAFFSLPYFPSSKTALLIPFLQENRKIVLVAHLASMLCYIFSLFIPYLCSRPKRALKEVARLWNFVGFFIQNP